MVSEGIILIRITLITITTIKTVWIEKTKTKNGLAVTVLTVNRFN